MLWNEKTQLLEGVFAMHYENSILKVPHSAESGITGHASASRKTDSPR